MQPGPEVGQILAGKYQVERVLGRGGMGVVVAARHLQLDQPVALKFLLPEASQQRDSVQRFLREARAAAKLHNEHVAKILDVGTLEGGSPYIVMEFLQGSDLSALVERRGALPVAEAIEYLLQTCEGLADAHKQGIVHRDLKPANLFLAARSDGSPCVKILDFGISKLIDGSDQGMTKTHEVMGSPQFMSPEQLRAARLADARSDVWALGVILFQLLTGRLPFDRDSFPELCTAIVLDPPPDPLSLRPDLPAALAAAALRCLQKDPANRFQSVAELARAIAPFGPEHAGISAERAARILGAGPRPAAPAPAASPAVEPTAPTHPALASTSLDPSARTSPPPAPPPGRAPWALGGLVALGGLGVTAFFLAPAASPAGAALVTSAAPLASPASPAPASATSPAPLVSVLVASAASPASAPSPPASASASTPVGPRVGGVAGKPPVKSKGATDFGDRR